MFFLILLLILTLMLKLRVVAWGMAIVFLLMGGRSIFRRMGDGKGFLSAALGTAFIVAIMFIGGCYLPNVPLWALLFA